MAYASASQGGYGGGPTVIHTDASHADAVSISDAELLFTGHLERKGPDLILTGHDGHRHIIPDYFSTEHPAALVAPNGARIAGDLVELLAGSQAPGQYAQDAQSQAAPTNSIGRIEKVVGDVTVMRNGVAVALHVGDAVYKNDVVQTGADSSAGIGFPDGTALNLVSNTRMALNDYVYDPNGTSNDALFNLVQGGFAFVAGKVAHTGDMKIGTPVATMGIRGTTGYALQQVATVSANVGNVTMSFAVVADPGSDRVGAYVVIDQFGNEVAVDRAGIWTTLSWDGGNRPPSVSRAAMTAANFATEQALVPALVQILNNINNLNPNPQSGPNNPGSSTPPLFELINLQQYLQQNGDTQQSIINIQNGGTNTQTQLSATFTIVLGAPAAASIVTWTSPVSGTWETAGNWSDLSTPAAPQYVNIAQPVKVTVETSESAYGLRIGAGAILNLTSGATLEVSQGIADFGTLRINSSGSDPKLAINGTVYLLNSGTLAMVGPTDENLIIGVAGTDATLVNVNNTITGSGTIGQGDGALTLVNGQNGTIEATPLLVSDSGLLIIDTGNRVSNSGTMTAADGGTLQIDDPVTNLGLIRAQADSAILITGRLDNENTVQAIGPGAQVTLSGGGHNQAEAVIASLSGGLILLDERIKNAGLISASGAGSTVDLDKAVIVGGTVESSAGGVIATTAGQSTFLNVSVANGSTVDTDQFSSLDLRGTTTIDGTVTFKGQGPFELHNQAEIVGGSQPAELDNFGTITGAGNIGGGDQHFVLVNEQSGTVDASGRLTLIIDNDSPGTASAPPSNAVINAGVIEATGSGGLTIENTTINNSAAAGTGHVDVFAGSQINLENATLLQGIISIAAGGELAVVGSSEVGDATVLGGGQVTVDGGQTLTWDAVTLDNVTLSGNFNNTAVLTIEDTVTLNGATLGGGTIDDAGTLLVSTDSEITRAAVNGGGDITVAIDQTLTFDTVTLDNVTLTGSFSNAGTTTTIVDAVTLNGATIAGGTVDLDSATSTVSSDSTIQLATLQDGTLAVAAGQTLTLNGLVLDNVTLSGGTDDLDSAFSLVNANSTIENATLQNGALTVAFAQTLTLDGATLGSVTLSGGTDDLDGASSVVTTESTIESTTLQDGMLTVASGETLTLLGVTLDNVTLSGGTDDLDQKSPLLVSTDSTIQYATLQDDGTLPDGKLVVASGQMVTLDGVTLDNVILLGGIDDLDGTTSTVSRDSTVEFATLQDGTLAVASGQMLTLDGVTLDNVILSGGTDDLNGDTSTVSTGSTIKYATLQDGTLAVASGQTLTLDDAALDNVTLAGGADLRGTTTLDGTVQFEGDGTFELHRQAAIVTNSHAELDNTGTIAGSGTIGTSGMALVNDGAINADDHNGTLILDPATLTNNAVLEAMNGGILDVVGNVTGTGSAAISGGGRLELGGTDAQTVTFDDASTLKLDGTSDFTGTVLGLAVGDIIDLAKTIVTSAAWDSTTLSVNGAPTTFTISDLPKDDTFAFTSDGGTGTDLTVETAPSIAINAIEGNDILNKAEAAAGFTISGTAFDSGVAVDGQSITIDIVNGSHKVVDSFTTTVSGGNWSVNVGATDAQALADGTYAVTANLSDLAVNPTTETTRQLTVDETTTTESAITDPAVTVGTDGNNYLNAAHFNGGSTTLSGIAAAGDSVSVIVDNTPEVATVAANGDWTLTLNGLSNGEAITAVATATDVAGNTASSAAYSFTVDTATTESAITDPAVTVGTDGNNYLNAAHFNGGSTTLSGIAAAGDSVSVIVDNTPEVATVAANGDWTLTLNGLSNGEAITAVATATDVAGNTASSAAYSFTVDTATPTITAGNTIGYTALAAPVAVDSGLTVTAASKIASASVSIGDGTFLAGDTLMVNGTTSGTINDGANGTISYSFSGSTLMLSGTDTVADYQQVLDSVTFSSASSNPTNSGADATRTIGWLATDVAGNADATAATTTINITAQEPAPTFTIDAAALSDLEGNGVLNRGHIALGTFSESASGTFAFVLSGAGASSFSRTFDNGNGTATLQTHEISSNVDPGNYALAVTATDNNGDTGTTPFDVWVGSSGNNTISLTGSGTNHLDISPTTPTIAYGLGGNDTVNATGMTAPIWFVGGAGSDTMTGGSGVNTYLYAAVSESGTPNEVGHNTASGTDTITNFTDGRDLISLAAMSEITKVEGSIDPSTTSINGDSVAWVVDTSNDTVTVYANTSSSSHSLTSNSGNVLQIDLTNDTAVSAGDFVLAPMITVPGAQTLGVGQAATITGVGVSDSGNTSGTFTVTLTDRNGLLSATGTGVSGTGTTDLTISGTLSQVTADLGTLQDKDSKTGSDTITVNATDGFGDSATQESIAVTVSSTADDWSNTSGGIWNSTGNWTNGIPGTTTNAYIQLDDTYTVTINDSPSIHSLTISDPNATVTDNGNTVTLTSGLTIDAGATFDGSGTISGTVGDNGTIDASVSGSTLQITGNISGSGSLDIENGAKLELGGTSTNTMTFEGTSGTWQIDNSGSSTPFSVEGTGDGGKLGNNDVIDLRNISFDSAADRYNSTTDVMTVGDGHGHTVTVDVAGGIGDGQFTFESDGHGGTEVFDPPATGSSGALVSIGGPGNDNFVFHPGVGPDTIANFNAKADTIELDHFANIQNMQQLAALITTDAHGGAVIELGHHDSITLPGVSTNYLQAHLHSLVHLS